jgi:hypothetical protein
MKGDPCTIEGCDRPQVARGWCHAHWSRWQRNGDVRADLPIGGVEPYERVMARSVEQPGGCRVWTGAVGTHGYGVTSTPRGAKAKGNRMVCVHRIVAEHHLGPSDLFVLHSCDNKLCVNIDHLRYGTHSDNMIDMHSRKRGRWGKARQ